MNIKKLISLILSVILIFSVFSVFAENETDKNEDKVFVPLSSIEFQALRTMEMLDDDFVSLSADNYVSRAQFIGALSRVAGFDTGSYQTEDIPFIDVNTETLHVNEICYFYEAGYINGTTINTFSPYEPITYNQAVKVILDICGYRELIMSKYGTGLSAYNAMSVYLKLSDGIAIGNPDAPLTAEKAVKLLYNAGRAPVLEPSYYTESDAFYTSGVREELFNIRNDIYYGEGILKSNGAVSLLSADVNESIAIIDNTEYFLPKVDLFSLIGCHVKFFYRTDGSTKQLLWVGESDKNNYLLLESDTLVPGDSRYSMECIVYENENKKRLAQISPYADIIYNNALYNDATIDQLKPAMGTIKLLDNDKDNRYDLVVVEEYTNCFVIGKHESLSYILDKYGNSIPVYEYENVQVYIDGKRATIDEIQINTVVSYVADRYKKHLVLYVTTAKGKGELISYGMKNGVELYEFETGEFKLSPSYINRDEERYLKVTPTIGRVYNYYFDKSGDIAEMEAVDDSVTDYALLIEAAPAIGWDSKNKAELKLLLRSGIITVCKTHKKLTLNGVKGKVGKDILQYDGLFDEYGETIEQVVRVGFTADGDLKEIEFATNNRIGVDPSANPYGYDDTKFSFDYQSSGSISTVDGVLRDGKYVVDSGCLTFAKYTNLEEEERYVVSNMSSVGTRTSLRKYYDINSKQEVSIAFATINTLGSNMSGQLLVSDVMYKLIDGEYVKTICGYYDAGYVEYPELYEGTIPDGIKRGDVLNISIHKNKLTSVSTFVSLADRPAPMGSYAPNTFQMLGYIYSAGNRSLNLLISDNISADAKYGKVAPVNYYKVGNTNVMFYDVSEDIMYRGSVQDLQTTIYPEKDGSITFDGNEILAVCKGTGYRNYGIIVVKY